MESLEKQVAGQISSACAVVKNLERDQVDIAVADNDFYLFLTEMEIGHKVSHSKYFSPCRYKITGQVVRTHPVHPELVHGTFQCLDCQTMVEGVER